MISLQTIVNKLIDLEAQAIQMAKDCRKTRKLIEGEVSTSPNNQVVSMEAHVSKKLARRQGTIMKHGK